MKRQLLFLTLMLMPLFALADAVEIDGIYYNLNETDKTAEVTSNPNNYTGEINIPEKVKYNEVEYSVNRIGSSAFSYDIDLKSVSIPSSVTVISVMAFERCSSLTSVNISEGVTTISIAAFSGCIGLTSITIPNSVKDISNSAFSSCSGLTSITIGNNVTSIGSSAFAGCSSLSSVTIPDSVTSIGISAFSGCSGLTSVTIGNNLSSIGHSAFNSCGNLASVHISDLSAWCKITFNSSDSNPCSSAHHLFLNGEELTSITIPNDITEIKDYAFYGCSGLASVSIPNSVTTIGNNAFADCTGLTSVHISDLSTWCRVSFSSSDSNPCSYAHRLFLNGEELSSITIPNAITEIKNYAFFQCI